MKRPHPGQGLALLSLFALLSTAQAQEALLSGYTPMVRALDAALTAQAQNPATSLERLEEAGNQYRKLSPDIGSRILASGVQNALSRARQAVPRSSADLAAQVGLVRGLMRRALQDALLDASEAQSAQALRLSSTLGNDLGMPQNERQQLAGYARAFDTENARKLIQRHAARKMQTALEAASSPDRDAAFRNMAQASAWFMSVQGSAESANLSSESFSTALRELVADNRAVFDSQRTALRAGTLSLVSSLRPGPASATPPEPEPGPVNTPDPASTPPEPSPGVAVTPDPARPNPTTPSVPAASGLGADEQVYPPLVRAMAAATGADVPGARSLLGEAQRAFEGGLGVSLAQVDPAAKARIDDRFRALTDGMSSVGLRVQDVQNLMTEISAADDAVLEKATMSTPASSAVGGVWQGWLRALLFIAIAVLAFLPLRYLNLAFGGRNRYWRYIGVAMVLLFVPAILEGLAHLGSILAEVSGVRLFDVLSNLSVFQNSAMQMLWALVLLVATGFAIAGFRGICIQFGLIRVRGQNFTTTAIDTNTTTTGGSSAKSGKNTFEWDEEF